MNRSAEVLKMSSLDKTMYFNFEDNNQNRENHCGILHRGKDLCGCFQYPLSIRAAFQTIVRGTAA